MTFTRMAGESRLEHAARAIERVLPWPGDTVLLIGDLASSLAPLLKRRFPWKDFVSRSLESATDHTPFANHYFACVVLAHTSQQPDSSSHLEACARSLGASVRVLVVEEARQRAIAAGLGPVAHGPVGNSGPFAALSYSPDLEAVPSRDYFRRVMSWLYGRVRPADGGDAETEPYRVLTNGKALCLGYALTLGHILRRDGFRIEYVTVLARDHERGRGDHRIDSHEIIQAAEREGGAVILDPMANALFPHRLLELLRRPSLAMRDTPPDARHRVRRYDLYDSPYFYERAFEACVRTSPAVTAYDSSGSWRAALKVLTEIGRRTVYQRSGGGSWRRLLVPLNLTGSYR